MAKYILGGAGAACTGVVLSGTYTQGTAMITANTASVDVHVTKTGFYEISTTTANAVTFSKSGFFTNTGVQQVVLLASSTPTDAGTTIHTVNGSSSMCTFPITYTAQQAIYVFPFFLGPGPADCTDATVQGTYTAGTVLDATNTVTLIVNVSRPGAYSITSNTFNGYSFTKSGTFTATGNQTVILNGNGTPIASGRNTFFPSTTTCNFYVVVY